MPKFNLCFFDDYFVAHRPATVRRMFAPRQLGVFNDERLGDQTYTSFFLDTRVRKYRLYVEVPASKANSEIRDLWLYEGDAPEDFIDGGEKLTRYKVNGFPGHIHGASVLYREAEKKYVFAGVIGMDNVRSSQLAVATSADGIDFSDVTPIAPFSDTYNSLYYNEERRCYSLTLRAGWGDRRIAVMHSADLKHWTKPAVLLHPTANGNTGLEYYAFGASYVNGIYYGINWRFVTDICGPSFDLMAGYMENDLYYSYEGDSFVKSELCPVAERPLPPAYGSKQLWLLNVCDAGERMILSGGSSKLLHGGAVSDLPPAEGKVNATVFYEIRRDGFAAIEGLGHGSRVLTKPFRLAGGELTLNFNARLGKITVAICDAAGKVLEGYSHEDCIPFCYEDSVCKTVQWKNAKLEDLRGKRVRFDVRLGSSMLYSMQFDGKLSIME